MRHLLNTLFILSEDSYAALDGENIVILREEETAGRFPLHNLETVLYFGYKGASPALLGACAARGVSFCFLDRRCRFLARVSGETRGNVLLRRQQYRLADDRCAATLIARNFICGKVYNARWSLERTIRDHPQRVDAGRLKQSSLALAALLPEIAGCTDPEVLLGLEGKAAALYLPAMDEQILNNKESFYFHARSRRPPLDRFNALLSFIYTLLAHDCAAALEAVGLDPYVGFLHRDRPGRISLALDLMEELRPPLADRFALTLVNTRVIQPEHFLEKENGAVWLNEPGRKAVLKAWQSRKQEPLQHPFLAEKIPWGLIPYVQALLLTRHLRGDLDAYPPFMWK